MDVIFVTDGVPYVIGMGRPPPLEDGFCQQKDPHM